MRRGWQKDFGVWALALGLALLPLGCNQIHVGFARFQLVNHTPHPITYFAVAHTEAGVKKAENLLAQPLLPNSAHDANVRGPGRYWLRAIANVDGELVERIEGPVGIFDGNKAWSWHQEGDTIRAGMGAGDIYAVSDLPVVVVNTNGAEVVDDPKVRATLHVADDPNSSLNWPLGEPSTYDGFAGIELRGNSSQTFDKKSFGLETWDEEDEGIDVELLGYPEEEDWVLYGPWMDRSLMRNTVGYGLWGDLGYYAPRTQYVELYLNTDNNPVVEETYHGVYVFTEKIKRDKNRVDIKKLDPEDIEEPKISGGYILEMLAPDQLDQGAVSFPVEGEFVLAIEEPSPEDIPQEQRDWITNYIGDFEAALFGDQFTDPEVGYAAYIDVANTIDYILFQDLLKNRDAFRSSVWMYKDRDQKLRFGPAWDLNIAFGYFSFQGFQSPEGWFLQGPKNDLPHSPWTDRLFQDPAFVERYIARWKQLRNGAFATDAIVAHLQDASADLKTAHVRNFVRWETLGKTLLPSIEFLMFLGPHPHSWQGEVEYLKDWIAKRTAWMDAHIDGLR